MAEDAAQALKARARADLIDAIKGKRADEISVLRSLVAAIDNAEAPALDGPSRVEGRSEIDRLTLTTAELDRVIATEIEARERAATELATLGHAERAAPLLRQARIVRRYATPAHPEDTGASLA